jgi:hypothetical protein
MIPVALLGSAVYMVRQAHPRYRNYSTVGILGPTAPTDSFVARKIP